MSNSIKPMAAMSLAAAMTLMGGSLGVRRESVRPPRAVEIKSANRNPDAETNRRNQAANKEARRRRILALGKEHYIEQRFIQRMTNWQRTQYSRALAAHKRGEGPKPAADVFAMTPRPDRKASR